MSETPDLSGMTSADLCALMLATGFSSDRSDRDFCKACRDELARRKPNQESLEGNKQFGHSTKKD